MARQDEVPPERLLLVTGATGYIGGRLLTRLEVTGHRIRCIARHPENLAGRVGDGTEVVAGDLLDLSSISAALTGVDTAFYLVHSMGSVGSFAQDDRVAARNFAIAAQQQGVRRIVFLGGLSHGSSQSQHLASRQEVGSILRGSGVLTVEFQASIVIGSGSLSFELVRALVDKLPIMVTPRWVRVRCQPIAIEDVLSYLVAAVDLDARESVVIEIGGRDAVSYQEMMLEYARQRGLKRLMIPVPVLTPRLSSLWLALVTPLYARVGRKLIDSLRQDTTVRSDVARQLFPGIQPRGLKEAIARALTNEDSEIAQNRWSDALSSTGAMPGWGGYRFGSRLVDSRSVVVESTPEGAFTVIEQFGGGQRWFYANWLWWVRGMIDQFAGGAGIRRQRPDAKHLRVGDTVGFWRVESVDAGRLVRLAAEMKLPGRAWLQFEIETLDSGIQVRQTALFDPVGVAGLVYWYGLYAIHRLIFRGMLRNIKKAAEEPGR